MWVADSARHVAVMFIGGVLVAAGAPSAFAHDMWLHAETRESVFVVEQRIGEGFEVLDRLTRFDERITRLELVDVDGVRDFREDFRPGGLLAVDWSGNPATIVLERAPSRIELDRETFFHYLEEESHLDLLESFANSDDALVSEQFSRHLKLILDRGAGLDSHLTRPADLTFEIVPGVNPARSSPGEEVPLVVLLRGEPVSDLPVTILSSGDDGEIYSETSVTDEGGAVTLPIGERGSSHLVRATYLRRCSDCPSADYESFWAALTFTTVDSGTSY